MYVCLKLLTGRCVLKNRHRHRGFDNASQAEVFEKASQAETFLGVLIIHNTPSQILNNWITRHILKDLRKESESDVQSMNSRRHTYTFGIHTYIHTYILALPTYIPTSWQTYILAVRRCTGTSIFVIGLTQSGLSN